MGQIRKEDKDHMLKRVFLVRVSYRFTQKRGARYLIFVRNILTLMPGLSAFPTPPSLAETTAEADSYEDLTEKASGGDRQAIKARDEQFVVLDLRMRDTGAYVQGNCQNSAAILTSTGFEAIAPRSASAIPDVPANSRLEYGKNSGTLIYRFKRSKGARLFSIQLADDPNGPWTDWGLTSRANNELSGLTPLKTKWARARANGAVGSSDWSEPTCKVVM
jgi:hypothetical protein